MGCFACFWCAFFPPAFEGCVVKVIESWKFDSVEISNECWVYCKVNPAWIKCWKMTDSTPQQYFMNTIHVLHSFKLSFFKESLSCQKRCDFVKWCYIKHTSTDLKGYKLYFFPSRWHLQNCRSNSIALVTAVSKFKIVIFIMDYTEII